MEETLFARPIQAVKAVSEKTGISRFTITQACQNGLLKDDAYQSGSTWLIDTTGQHFRQWLMEHKPRMKGEKQKGK